MEQWGFHDLTRPTVEAFLTRIPQKQVDGFEGTLIGGAFSMAVENLVYDPALAEAIGGRTAVAARPPALRGAIPSPKRPVHA